MAQVTPVARVWSLAQEHADAMEAPHGAAKKKKNVFLKEIKQQIVYAYGHSDRLVDEFVSLKIILMLV